MMRLTMILLLTLVMMAQVALSGHCIHNFFECYHSLGQSEGDRNRPVREVYSAATSVTLSVSVVAMVLARILI